MYCGQNFAIAEQILPGSDYYYIEGVNLDGDTLNSMLTDGNRVVIFNIDSSQCSYGVELIISANIPSSVDSVRISLVNSPEDNEYTGLIIGKTKSYPVINGISKPYFYNDTAEPILITMILTENEEGYIYEINVNGETKAVFQFNSSIERYQYVRIDALGAAGFVLYSELSEEEIETSEEPSEESPEEDPVEESLEEEQGTESGNEEPEPIIEQEDSGEETEDITEDQELTDISDEEESTEDIVDDTELNTTTHEESNGSSEESELEVSDLSNSGENEGEITGDTYAGAVFDFNNLSVIIGIAVSSIFLGVMWFAHKSKVDG
jgi:hypothetical protein